MMKLFLSLAALSGLIAVAGGGFGVHGLEGSVSERELKAFETGARYQMYHALALAVAALVAGQFPSRAVTVAGWSFAIGTLLFTGPLYVMGLTGSRALVMVTPIGGLGFMIDWAALFVAAIMIKRPR